jgi:hypothetical protein
MSQPIVVTIPHQLGKAEALRRLQRGFSDAGSNPGGRAHQRPLTRQPKPRSRRCGTSTLTSTRKLSSTMF